MVRPDSWLGRHHVQLQWGLLIAGLCLRLLGANSDPLWLGLWLLLTLAAALAVGWAFGRKAWCHYICPMGPVQTVLTGMRGPLGTTAHVAAPSRLTQSMCRTITPAGEERSAPSGTPSRASVASPGPGTPTRAWCWASSRCWS